MLEMINNYIMELGEQLDSLADSVVSEPNEHDNYDDDQNLETDH